MQHAWLVALAAVLPHSSATAQQRVDVRRAVAPDISIRMAGAFGKLRIVGWNKDSVTVTGTLPKEARFEAYFGGSASQPSRGAKMFVEAPNDLSPGVPGTLEMHVPSKARVWAKSGTAEIVVESR